MITSLTQDSSKVLNSVVFRAQNLFQKSLKDNIFYLHVPKCGGISTRTAIKSCYLTFNVANDKNLVDLVSTAAFNAAQINANQTNLSSDTTNDFQVLKFRENLLLYYMCQDRTKYIAGHFTFSEVAYENFKHKFSFITMLRDPVKRWVSAYLYNRFKQLGHRKIDKDIMEYLDSDFSQTQGYEYVKFIGGVVDTGNYSSDDAINKAKDNLHKFKVVGCLEYQNDFVKQFQEQFGIKLQVPHVSPSNQRHIKPKHIIDQETEDRIREICRPDIEIYNYALSNFVRP